VHRQNIIFDKSAYKLQAIQLLCYEQSLCSPVYFMCSDTVNILYIVRYWSVLNKLQVYIGIYVMRY